jgi:hypothetical protein
VFSKYHDKLPNNETVEEKNISIMVTSEKLQEKIIIVTKLLYYIIIQLWTLKIPKNIYAFFFVTVMTHVACPIQYIVPPVTPPKPIITQPAKIKIPIIVTSQTKNTTKKKKKKNRKAPSQIFP